ncbi:hypothetical protein HYT45_00455 [Candidatus Uhrbacteria bacterium]|nr:hypothetical protein [Candidatus Uhrbacteria bacterium]
MGQKPSRVTKHAIKRYMGRVHKGRRLRERHIVERIRQMLKRGYPVATTRRNQAVLESKLHDGRVFYLIYGNDSVITIVTASMFEESLRRSDYRLIS